MSWHRFLLLAPLCLALSACGLFGGSEPANQPAELKPIKHPQIKAKVLWRRGIGDGTPLFSALRPIVHEKLVYAADAHGNIWAFNANNGKTVWKHATHLRLLSGPTLADGLLLVGGLKGHVVALDPKTGKKRWGKQLSSEVLSAPAGSDGTIVARCVDGITYGLSSDNGNQLWTYQSPVPRLSLRGAAKPTIANDDVILGLDNGKLVALSLDTGEVDWKSVLAVPTGASELEQLVDVDGHVAHHFGELYAASYGGKLAAMNTATGQILWRDDIASYSGVTLGDDMLYVSDNASTLYSLSSLTGKTNWKTDVLAYRQLTRPVLQGDNVVVGDKEGYLHWFTQDSGKRAGRFQVEDVGFTSAPAIAGKRLYVEADNGRLTALEIQPVKHPGKAHNEEAEQHGNSKNKPSGEKRKGSLHYVHPKNCGPFGCGLWQGH